MINNTLTYNSFEDAFKGIVSTIYKNPQFKTKSRNGESYETLGLSYKVLNPRTYEFGNKNLGRISYEYADHFYKWMINGCSDEATEEFKTKYSNVIGFLEKPKSENLPDNFNVFYGPRILRQLPAILNELSTQENSRRAVINILNEDDQKLFDAQDDPNLEYPCCDSSTLSIRDGKLYQHLHMRSNNMGNVAKLDMYLWGRFQCEIAEKLNVEVGEFTCSIVSAHIFEKDFKYFYESGIFYDFETKSIFAKSLLKEILNKNNSLNLIRHEKSEHNLNRKLQGQSNSPLVTDETTKERAKNSIIKNVVDPKTENIIFYTSELGRTIDSLNIIKENIEFVGNNPSIISYSDIEEENIRKLRVKELNNLGTYSDSLINEINWGPFEEEFGEPTLYKEIDRLLSNFCDYGITCSKFLESDDVETFGDVINRIIDFLIKLTNIENTMINIVGHGLWIQIFNKLCYNKSSTRLEHLGNCFYNKDNSRYLLKF